MSKHPIDVLSDMIKGIFKIAFIVGALFSALISFFAYLLMGGL